MLTILHTESSTGWGGQEIRILQESLCMRLRGYRVIIAAPERSEIYRRTISSGIKTYRASFIKKNPLSIARITSIINKEGVDVVNTHSSADSWIATFGAKLSKRKPLLIRTRHLSTPISTSYFSRLIYNVMPDAVITTGEEIRKNMIEVNGFDGRKIFSIPSGVDLSVFNPERVNSCLERTAFSVGMVSVLRSWKGHEYFIMAVPEILKQIPDASCYIVGMGPRYEHIKNFIKERFLENKVSMLGHREDIPEIMASLDLLVHPSYANEGVPQSVLQALAMKKAVVASDTGAIKEVIVDGETGFLIRPKDPIMLSDRVIQLYKNPELRKRLGNEGRKLVEEEYSEEAMLDRIEELYHQLFQRSAASIL